MSHIETQFMYVLKRPIKRLSNMESYARPPRGTIMLLYDLIWLNIFQKMGCGPKKLTFVVVCQAIMVMWSRRCCCLMQNIVLVIPQQLPVVWQELCKDRNLHFMGDHKHLIKISIQFAKIELFIFMVVEIWWSAGQYDLKQGENRLN